MSHQGFAPELLERIRQGFAGHATLDFGATAKLLRMHEKTLRGHVRSGNIGFRATGLGGIRVRREFAIEDVLDFYTRAFRRLEPGCLPQPVARTLGPAGRSFLEGRAARKAVRGSARGSRSGGNR